MVNSANLSRISKQPKPQQRNGNKPIGLLGDIEFEVFDAPNGFRFTEGSKFAEHSKIEKKPGLQWVGEDLNQIELQFRFHAGWCDPDQQLQELQKARKKHEPMPLILGSGRFKGNYVIEDIRTDLVQTDLEGKTIQCDLSVNLKETREKPKQKKLKKSPFLKKLKG